MDSQDQKARQLFYEMTDYHNLDAAYDIAVKGLKGDALRSFSIGVSAEYLNAGFECGSAFARGDMSAASETLKRLSSRLESIARDAEREAGAA